MPLIGNMISNYQSFLIDCLIQDYKQEHIIKILIDKEMTIKQFKLKV